MVDDYKVYLIVMYYNGSLAPVGQLYYSLDEAKSVRDRMQIDALSAIIEMGSGIPPRVVS